MRTIKTLGIATAMALALIAFAGAGSASANYFKVGAEPAKWDGSILEKNHVLELNEIFSCSGVSFSGETTNKSLSQVTVSPELTKCAHNGTPTQWAMNGCKFRFRPGAGPALVGTLDIVGCEKPMTNSSGCISEISNQTGLGPVEYRNVESGGVKTITMIAKVKSITFTRSGGPCSGGTGTFNNGSYTGEWTVKGSTNPGGVPAGVSVESTTPPPPTIFTAEEAPVTIAGADTHTGSSKRFSPGGNNSTGCETFTVSGSSATVSSGAITVKPVYKSCSVNGQAVPDGSVSAGGCSYVLHANGELDIAGATCASNPMTITRPGCVASIGPQSGLTGGLKYTNEGSGKLSQVTSTGGVNGVTTTLVGPACAEQGTYTGGSIYVAATFKATNSSGKAQGFWVN